VHDYEPGHAVTDRGTSAKNPLLKGLQDSY
jgi:hypothetical protein